jgi:predicted MFS family arabinose efflux permease
MISEPALPHRAILGLALTQLTGWGTTYYVPSVLAPKFAADLGLTPQLIFGGITLMLLVSAATAPVTSRLIESRGARTVLVLGSVLMALALLVLASAQGMWTYGLSWLIVGIAAPAALLQGALSALAGIAGPGARRAIARLLLITGLAATVFWPLTTWLEGLLGWRGTLFAYAAANLLLCVPVIALVVPRHARAPKAAVSQAMSLPLAPEAEKAAFILSAAAFSFSGFVTAGLGPLLVQLLGAFGHSTQSAVAIGALVGPAVVIARLGEVSLGSRVGTLAIGLIALVVLPLAVTLPLLSGSSAVIATIFVVAYGMAGGTMTVVRSVLPLALFGRDRYNRLLGSLAVPQNTALALAPMIFAAMLSAFGPQAAILLSLIFALLALGAMVALAMLVRRRVV